MTGNENLSYKSAGMFAVKASELENEFKDKFELSGQNLGTVEAKKDANLQAKETASSPNMPTSGSTKVAKASGKKENSEEQKPRKPMPPKPWLMKKKVNKEVQDPFVIDFPQLAPPVKSDSQPGGDLEGLDTAERVEGNECKGENNELPYSEENYSIRNNAGQIQEHQIGEVPEFGDDEFKPANDGKIAIQHKYETVHLQ